MRNQILIGDCLETMKSIPDKHVDCVITSPPYYGLRDYGVDGQIGLEASPKEFIEKMVEVFAEVHRILKDDGTLWLNIGDSYWSGKNRNGYEFKGNRGKSKDYQLRAGGENSFNYKRKDLMGIPWRLAFALQDFGWYLRSDIIWYKPNPMPEAVKDRPSKAHEYLFLFSKSDLYYYNYKAIREVSAEKKNYSKTFRNGTYIKK